VLDPRVSAKPFLYTYDTRASVVAQLAMPTGQTIAYARDAQGRLLSTTLSGTARQTLATHAYTYDLAGQRTTATTASATTAYTYDALRQLATATETPAGTGQTPTREFAYAYDPIGNRLTAATAAETTAYTANSVNQYTAIVPGTGLPFAPTYDANGNTTTLPSGLVLDYDEENRLVSAATQTAREEYTYDGLGRRVERRTFTASSGLTAPVTSTRYVYDGWRVLEELTSTQSSPFTLHSSYTRGLDLSGTLEGAGGIGGLLAMTRDPAGSATSAYYFHDGNGNVSTLVSASDALLASYTYTPFGDTLTATGTWASVNAYRFSAKESDAFTGLYYYGLRYYNPSTGRWLSRDPIQERGGVNLYGFVANDPITAVDPDGAKILISTRIRNVEGVITPTRFAFSVMTGLRQAVGDSGVIGANPITDDEGNTIAWQVVIRSENPDGKCSKCWEQLKQAINAAHVIRIRYDRRMLDNAAGETTGRIRDVLVNPDNLIETPEVSPGFVYDGRNRWEYEDKKQPWSALLWHEAIGHSSLGIEHPGNLWNQFGMTDSSQVDPVIEIENMARECLRQNGFNVGERYPKYHGVP
jgi:RHS repeat-associated protein